MERYGALAFEDRVSFLLPVDDRAEIVSFDEDIFEDRLLGRARHSTS